MNSILPLTGIAVVAIMLTLVNQNRSLRTDLNTAELLLQGCQARTTNIVEDKESDETINDLTDDDLRDAPERWIMQ